MSDFGFSPLTDWMPVDDPCAGDLAVGGSFSPGRDEPIWPAGWTANQILHDVDSTSVVMYRVLDGTEVWPQWMHWRSGDISTVRVQFARAVPGGEGVGRR